jgi:hypothetical protein
VRTFYEEEEEKEKKNIGGQRRERKKERTTDKKERITENGANEVDIRIKKCRYRSFLCLVD